MNFIEKKELGTVKWFDEEKGFGVITGESGEDIFLHRNSIKDSVSMYIEGRKVIFQRKLDEKKGRIACKECAIFSKQEHWLLINELIKLSSKEGKNKQESSGIETSPFSSLIEAASVQFAGYHVPEILIDCLKESFEELKTHVRFEAFVAFCDRVIFRVFRESKGPKILQKLYEFLGQNLDFDILFDSWEEKRLRNFWSGNQYKGLVINFLESKQSEITDSEKFELFLKGLYPNLTLSEIRNKIPSTDSVQILEIVKSKLFSNEDALILYPLFINHAPELSETIFEKAKSSFSESLFLSFKESLSNILDEEIYLKLWEKEKVDILQSNHLKKALRDKKAYFDKITELVKTEKISSGEVSEILKNNIQNNLNPESRNEFKILEYSLLNLIQVDPLFEIHKKISDDKTLNLILWANFHSEDFDFEALRNKFIYFDPAKQVEIIKKLFFLKATEQFDLTIDKLSSLTKFDLNLFLLNQEIHPEIPIDVSTDLLIKLLDSIHNKGEFLFESDLITLVLNDILVDKTFKFKISNYFEKCEGRTEVAVEKDINGTVEKKDFKDKYYFEVFVEHERNHWKHNPDKNPDAPKVVSAIKSIPGSKFNPEESCWGIPGKYETQVSDLITTHKLQIIGAADKWQANKHLASKKLSKVPNGITYCEGRASNKKDSTFNEDFWWCNGLPCLNHCETIHAAEDWRQYTLLDFLRILNINSDEITPKGELIPNGKFYRFITTINRFNELLKKLYCSTCDHFLHPLETGNFGARNVTRFHCANEKCENEEVVYLNHCLNGKCNNIVDSRSSKTCPNGLYICDKCGCCCSHAQMSRRIDNLKLAGGSIGSTFKNSVEKRLGHLERKVFFCFKCGGNMESIGNDKNKLTCRPCKVEYDLRSYNLKFPHIHLPKEPTDYAKSIPHDSEKDDEDIPF